MSHGKRNPSPSPRGLTSGCHRNCAAGQEPKLPWGWTRFAWRQGSPDHERGDQRRRTRSSSEAAFAQQQLFHKVTLAESQGATPPLLSSPDGRTCQACNSESAKLKMDTEGDVRQVPWPTGPEWERRSSMFDYCKEPHAAPRQGADAP